MEVWRTWLSRSANLCQTRPDRVRPSLTRTVSDCLTLLTLRQSRRIPRRCSQSHELHRVSRAPLILRRSQSPFVKSVSLLARSFLRRICQIGVYAMKFGNRSRLMFRAYFSTERESYQKFLKSVCTAREKIISNNLLTTEQLLQKSQEMLLSGVGITILNLFRWSRLLNCVV